MFTDWSKHLSNDKDKLDFERYVYNSKRLLERIKEILTEKGEALERSEVNIKTYETPNWQYRQAHKNGYRECLNTIKTLVDMDQQKPPKEGVT